LQFTVSQGFVGRELGQPGLKPTVRVGEAALREVAAFLLDHENFAKVSDVELICTPLYDPSLTADFCWKQTASICPVLLAPLTVG
jgi:hypothetical protein